MELVTNLASRIDDRLERDLDSKSSGVVINTCGWTENMGYDILFHCIKVFHVDVVLVMGHDKIFSKLCKDISDDIVVVKLPKSGGVVERVMTP